MLVMYRESKALKKTKVPLLVRMQLTRHSLYRSLSCLDSHRDSMRFKQSKELGESANALLAAPVPGVAEHGD